MATPSIPPSVRSAIALLSAALMLSACAYAMPNPTPPYFSGRDGPGDPTTNRVGGPDGVSMTIGTSWNVVGSPGVWVGVDPFLWRGALDTFSSLPLASADPLDGVIISDWYSKPGDAGERFKATAFLEGPEPGGNGLRVSVFRQVNQGGRWVDAPSSPTMQTEIQNKVLNRARQLWDQATGRG